MDEKESANVKVSDLWMEFGRNKPLRVVAFFFITAFAMMSVSNAADAYFMTFNVGATPLLTTLFMWLGTIPAFIFMPKIGKKGMFYLFLGVAIIGMILMYTFVSIPATKSNFVLLCIAQFVKSTGIITATGYMWALVPEVIAYGEYTTGKRIAGIVNALTGIFFKAGMASPASSSRPAWPLAVSFRASSSPGWASTPMPPRRPRSPCRASSGSCA